MVTAHAALITTQCLIKENIIKMGGGGLIWQVPRSHEPTERPILLEGVIQFQGLIQLRCIFCLVQTKGDKQQI